MVQCVVFLVALCGLNLESFGVWCTSGLRWVFYSLRNYFLLYNRIAKFICCFINPNQLYVEYIYFWWFEYFWVCWTYQQYFGELNIVFGLWNELCDCVLWLGILNTMFCVWEIVVVTCLWILGRYQKLLGAYCIGAWIHNLLDTWVRDSVIWVRDSNTWVRDLATWVKDLVTWAKGSGDLHMHTYICGMFVCDAFMICTL
jgi:hypothetical protein